MHSEKKKKLIADIDSLGQRFPVVYVSRLTGYSKSNVSEYYNGEKEPSEQFLQKFYKEFYKLKKLSDLGSNNSVEEESTKYTTRLDEMIGIIKKQAETILSQQTTISILVGNSSAPAVNAVG